MMADISLGDLDRTCCSDVAAGHTQSFKSFVCCVRWLLIGSSSVEELELYFDLACI